MTLQRWLLLALMLATIAQIVLVDLNSRRFLAWDARMDEAATEYQHAIEAADQAMALFHAADIAHEQWQALLHQTGPCQGL